ncbi:D-alanyl-D-alanine carboxypeptidase [Streptomyces sp. LP05-1]|uniref:D-alanyl-D-alanine carboxypeptidase n=1 Tax=Streptomyces pyxinae TaxID=2970734 RepID=A0ABT2CEM1_9ACTN|nr:D-alanyl-D-alanine carboxypeptidase [Streptomyces sp. LP05-1]MCS0635857.1 D-alanyl-D-alanine carboxypeptidase [Streptomyces sp. LP05-1]
MAGESPDKSEQQKSSGRTAPGERDPRLAVLGDERTPDRKDQSDRAAKPVDQPTAVFRAPGKPAAGESGAGKAGADEAAAGKTGAGESGAEKEPAEKDATGKDSAATKGSAKEDSTAKNSTAKGSAGGEGDERLKAAVAAWVAEDAEDAEDAEEAAEAGEAEDTGGAEGASDADAAEDTGGVRGAGAEGSGSGSDGVPGARTTADDAEAGGGGLKDGAAGVGRPGGEARPADRTKKDTDGEGTAEEAGEGAPGEARVDQPTAVFRAAPRKPVEDQPTTALKAVAPGAAAKASDAAPAESPAERTSKFVPLRGDDVRPAVGGTAPKTPAAPATAVSPKTPAPSKAEPSSKAGAGAAGAGAGTAAGAGEPAALTGAERTTQQPMPPRPPLDLLAELTNTPPPPETPVRTLVRRVKIWTPLVVLLVIVFAVVQAVRPLPAPELALSAEPTYTFGGGKLEMPWPTEGQGAVEVEGVGRIGTYGEQKPAPIASVAKTMTAYIILRDHPIKPGAKGPVLTIEKLTEEQASNPDWSVAEVKEGKQYTLEEMLQMLMLRSANNVAHQLARWDSGTEEKFIKKMNDTAKELGMTGTTYTDPSGFDKTTVSTPLDQIKLAKAAMQDAVLRKTVDLPQVEMHDVGLLYNGNKIVNNPGVIGLKTGSSTPAGGNLLWVARTIVDGKERRIFGAVMGVQNASGVSARLEKATRVYSRGLVEKAQSDIDSAVVVKKGAVVGYVDDGLGGRTPLVTTADLKAVGWPGLKVDLRLTGKKDGVPHEAPRGTVVGELSIGSGTGKTAVPVVTQQALAEPGFGAKLTRLG